MSNVIVIGEGFCSMGYTHIIGHGCLVSFKKDEDGTFFEKYKSIDSTDYKLLDQRLDEADAVISFTNKEAIDLMIRELVELKYKMGNSWDTGYPIDEYDEEAQSVLYKLGGK